MFGTIKGRLIVSLVTTLLFFSVGSGVTIFALYSEIPRFESLNLDSTETARERLPLLTALGRIQEIIGVISVAVLKSVAQHHSIDVGLGSYVGDELASKFWTDLQAARLHAANLGLVEVIEGIDTIERIFPQFFDASLNISRAYNAERGRELDDEMMVRFSRLGHILDGSINDLPRLVEQLTTDRLNEITERAVGINRNKTTLLGIIVVTTMIGGALALASSLYLFRLLSTQYQYLKAERDRAEIATQARTEFLFNMSHELRTPLNAIIGFSEIMEQETLGPVGNPSYRIYATDIRESGQHLLSLINDILDLSKINSGRAELHEDVVDIATAIRATLTLLGPRAEQRGIKLELALADELPALFADERKLKQILINLLANAVKFTESGGTVTLKVCCPTGSGHVFQIVDTGIGIATTDIDKAMRLFGQVDGKFSRQYEGTGLGLPLSAGLVKLHGGSLDMESEVGVGTTVTIRLPATRVVGPQDESSRHLENRAVG